jgi:hypothetical protein
MAELQPSDHRVCTSVHSLQLLKQLKRQSKFEKKKFAQGIELGTLPTQIFTKKSLIEFLDNNKRLRVADDNANLANFSPIFECAQWLKLEIWKSQYFGFYSTRQGIDCASVDIFKIYVLGHLNLQS